MSKVVVKQPAKRVQIIGVQGPVGPIGPQAVIWQGEWSVTTAYAVNDGVLYQGSSWRCLVADTGHAPPALPTTVSTFWQLLAAKGDEGEVPTPRQQEFLGNNTAGPYPLAYVPVPESLMASINGLDQLPGTHFSVSANAITFGEIVPLEDVISVNYVS
jgi:hypothetical protein